MSIESYIINASNVHITINEKWVDEAVSISAQRQATHSMLYGYMDVDARRPTRGNSIVVGTIGIHHRSSDYLMRYLINSRPDYDSRTNALAQRREALKEFKSDAELLAYMASTDLGSKEFDLLAEAVKRNAYNDPSNAPEDEAKSPDVVGEDGFNASITRTPYEHPTKKRKYLGNVIKIYYGDAELESFAEAIYGVVFTGEAMSPLENTGGVSADPLMKYFSFIAVRIDSTGRDPYNPLVP